jgi:hypothetical protein
VNPNRRSFLYGLGATLGTVAFNAFLRGEQAREGASPVAVKPPHHRGRAKACIFLYMEGGPSHIDTFDPKPKLADLHMKEFVRNDKLASVMANGKRYFIQSPFKFHQAGKAGIWMNERFIHLAEVADELCIYRGCVGESIDHPTANFHMMTGNRLGGDPGVGAWISYGLGTINQNLPGFVVLPEVHFPQGGTANWSNGFLPAHFQGSPLRAKGSPILDLHPPAGVAATAQRKNLDLLAAVEKEHLQDHPENAALAARLHTYELAFRMQAHVPEIIDLGREAKATLAMYGIGEPDTDGFGRRCLLARRLVEKGVRFVQVYAGGWDSHDYIEKSHGARIQSVDKPIAALIADLKRLGLLDETLIVCCGEFGRSPDNGIRDGGQRVGRDHNAKAMTVWFAGGGTKAGHVIGTTDDIGDQAVDVVHPIRDLHITILHLLGLDDNKLTYFHAGRFKQLSQVGGSIIKELVG